jgi:hypothetical protein
MGTNRQEWNQKSGTGYPVEMSLALGSSPNGTRTNPPLTPDYQRFTFHPYTFLHGVCIFPTVFCKRETIRKGQKKKSHAFMLTMQRLDKIDN